MSTQPKSGRVVWRINRPCIWTGVHNFQIHISMKNSNQYQAAHVAMHRHSQKIQFCCCCCCCCLWVLAEFVCFSFFRFFPVLFRCSVLFSEPMLEMLFACFTNITWKYPFRKKNLNGYWILSFGYISPCLLLPNVQFSKPNRNKCISRNWKPRKIFWFGCEIFRFEIQKINAVWSFFKNSFGHWIKFPTIKTVWFHDFRG